jgi:hypothetical protein
MNEEEEEAPLEDPCIPRNCLAREKHAPGLKKKKWFKEIGGLHSV